MPADRLQLPVGHFEAWGSLNRRGDMQFRPVQRSS